MSDMVSELKVLAAKWRDHESCRERYPISAGTAYNVRCHCADELEASLALEQKDGWRTIDSAPRDGSWFLTYIPGMEGDDAFDFAHFDTEWDEFCKIKCGFDLVTHWMPLRAPAEVK